MHMKNIYWTLTNEHTFFASELFFHNCMLLINLLRYKIEAVISLTVMRSLLASKYEWGGELIQGALGGGMDRCKCTLKEQTKLKEQTDAF